MTHGAKPEGHGGSGSRTTYYVIAAAVAVAIAIFALRGEHRGHILSVLPWLILLACPFLHRFAHRNKANHHNPERRSS